MTTAETAILTAIVSATALIVGYSVAFLREVVVAGMQERREAAARRAERRVARHDRQRSYLVELQDQLALFGQAWGTIQSAHIQASKAAGTWTLVRPPREASDADLSARTRISALQARILDAGVRDTVSAATSLGNDLILPASYESSASAMNALIARLDAAHARIGEVLRRLEAEVEEP